MIITKQLTAFVYTYIQCLSIISNQQKISPKFLFFCHRNSMHRTIERQTVKMHSIQEKM